MVGVSAVAIHTNRWIHWIIAGIMFISGVFVVVSLPFLEESLQVTAPRWLVRFRRLIAAFVAVSAILLAATISCETATASVAEIVVTALVILYLISLAHNSEFPLVSRLDEVNTVFRLNLRPQRQALE